MTWDGKTPSDAAIHTLWHMLGIELRKEWIAYRNYYAPAVGEPSAELLELEAAGLAEPYRAIDQNTYYRTTEAGIRCARTIHAAQRKHAGIKVYEYRVKGWGDQWGRCQGATRSKARYTAYLSAHDALPDIKIIDIEIGKRVA